LVCSQPKPVKRPAAAAATTGREPPAPRSADAGAEAIEIVERLRETETEDLLAGIQDTFDGEDFDEALLERLYEEFVAAVMAAQGRVPGWAEMHKAAAAALAGMAAAAGLRSTTSGDDTVPDRRVALPPELPPWPSGCDPP
jgi:hypothetical protein